MILMYPTYYLLNLHKQFITKYIFVKINKYMTHTRLILIQRAKQNL